MYLRSGRIIQNGAKDAIEDIVDERRGGGAHSRRVVIRFSFLLPFHDHLTPLSERHAGEVDQRPHAWRTDQRSLVGIGRCIE